MMREEHIDKVVELYRKRETVDKLTHLASFEEIEQNDYNLNIPRYVDTSEAEEEINLRQLSARMEETNRGIREGNDALLCMLRELTFSNQETKEAVGDFMKILKEA